MHLSYKSKLLLYFTALFAAFTLLLVMFQYNREKQYRRDLLESRLRSYSDVVAGKWASIAAASDSLRQTSLVEFLPAELRVTVVSRRGRVLYDSGRRQVEGMDNHLTRPEVKLALRQGEGSDIRHSDTDQHEYFYFAKNYPGGIVRVGLPYDASVRSFMKADNVFLWFVLMLFPVAMVVLIHIADRFGKAVGGLRDFVRSADRGLVDYAHIDFPGSELGDIGRSIMAKYKLLEESRSQIALEQSRLMRHFHYFEEGIAIFSPERQRVYANPRFMQYVNVILDRPTADTNAIWQSQAFAPALEFLRLNGGERAETADVPVFRYTLPAGSTFFAVQQLIYRDGSFELTLSDVTKVEKNKRLKQQISNNVTHELRTPVSSIRGYIETLLECPGLGEERKRYFLEKAHAQVVRLTDLIRDVALITKTEEAPDTLPRESIDVAHVLDDVAEDLRPRMEEAGLTMHTDLPARLTVTGNYSLVYSIFRNLLENSIRYAGAGAAVQVSCYNVTPEFCYFSFADTGQGVPEEHLPRLFERFYRVTEGRTRDNGGTGLGLSIVRNAVLFHHGDISVRNRREGGLEFLFTLHR